MADTTEIAGIDVANKTNTSTSAHGKAEKAVLGTYELVEATILALPPEDILLAANVCQTWYHIVQRSMKLRDSLVVALENNVRYIPWTTNKLQSALIHRHSFGTPGRTLVIRRLGELEVFGFVSPTKQRWLTLGDQALDGGFLIFEYRYDDIWAVYRGYMGVTETDFLSYKRQEDGMLFDYLKSLMAISSKGLSKSRRQLMVGPAKYDMCSKEWI